MLLTICHRTARLAARAAVTSQFSNRTREREREGRTGRERVKSRTSDTDHTQEHSPAGTSLLGPHGSTAFTEKPRMREDLQNGPRVPPDSEVLVSLL